MEDKGYMPSTNVSFSATPAFVRAWPDEAALQQQNFEKPSWHKTAPLDIPPPPSYQAAKGPPPSAPTETHNPLLSDSEPQDTRDNFQAIAIILCIFGVGIIVGYVGTNWLIKQLP